MSGPADLAALFAPPPPGPSQDVRYRQGVLHTFDPVTLENTVNVGGTIVTDLAILGDTALLAIGAVVGILVVTNASGTSTWMIVGRLVTPTPAPP